MDRNLTQRLRALLIAVGLTVTPMAASGGDDTVTGDKGSDMLVDLVVVRPLGVAATIIGAAAFVVALPFTVPSGSVGDSAREMIGKPAEYTFTRPLGEFDRCGAERHSCGAW